MLSIVRSLRIGTSTFGLDSAIAVCLRNWLLRRECGEASTTRHCGEEIPKNYAEIQRRSSEVGAANDEISGQGKQQRAVSAVSRGIDEEG
jgi:hypothetical protein